MCGIVGYVGKRQALPVLMDGLRRMEYRGYDSWGIATNGGFLEKKLGEIPKNISIEGKSNVAIAHTRWATHGGVTQLNAHPHSDCSGNIRIIHNGIIENYLDMKNSLIKKGHKFQSETDTEVIAHYIEELVKSGKNIDEALRNFISDAQGTFLSDANATSLSDAYNTSAANPNPLIIFFIVNRFF